MREFGDWQDMTSAPRDGTRILVEIRASEQGPAEVDLVRWVSRERSGVEGWVSTESDADASIFYEDGELSGWMPLPAPLPRLRTVLQEAGHTPRAGSHWAEVDGSGI